ncbi:mitochondrial-processing peptidase subunit alpha-like [Styela clava]
MAQRKVVSSALIRRSMLNTVSKIVKSRSFSSSTSKVPLSKPLGNAPNVVFAEGDEESDTHVTTLSNGLKVASQTKFGTFCTVGILVDAGSRHECFYPSGVSHLLERLSFSGSRLYQTRDDVMKAVENFGGICDCQSSRDTMIYAASVSRENLPSLVELLGDCVFQPALPDTEIEQALENIKFELQQLDTRPDPEPLMTELIHEAAFRGNTVGLPKFPKYEEINKLDRKTLHKFLRSHYIPSRMVLAGVGVEHEELCDLAEKHISSQAKNPTWSLDGDVLKDESTSQYTGGEVHLSKTFDLSMSVVPLPDLAHVSVGMQSVAFTHPDFVPFAVLNMLMGGGGSFSAGGPGKGMFSRLYLNVLNRHHWMYAATAFHHSYDDGGLFCIQASTHPSQIRECVHVITQEFVRLLNGVEEAELLRAKTQLKSMLMMNLESRPVMFEDVGRQVLATGLRKSPQELCEMIESVSNDDILRVANRMLSSRPSVAALGDVSNCPSLADIQTALNSKDGKLPRKFRLFGR